MNCFLVLLAFAAVSHAATIPSKIMDHENGELWKAWKEKYDKSYETQAEELNRFKIWSENLKNVAKHNVEYEFGLQTYTRAVNMFADMTKEEFEATYTGGIIPNFPKASKESVYQDIDTSNLPREVNWVEEGWVTSVKVQGACGDCWIFSAIGALEGQHFNATKKLVSLSAQQVVDCQGQGCYGGAQSWAFDYWLQKGSISEKDYPYHSQDGNPGDQCLYSSYPIAATMSKYESLPQSEAALQAATATIGPISVSINSSAGGFDSYAGGVYTNLECSDSIDHGLLVVGYGTEQPGGDYWLVKNSWGPDWGMNGYIKMARNRGNMCAIASHALYPLV